MYFNMILILLISSCNWICPCASTFSRADLNRDIATLSTKSIGKRSQNLGIASTPIAINRKATLVNEQCGIGRTLRKKISLRPHDCAIQHFLIIDMQWIHRSSPL